VLVHFVAPQDKLYQKLLTLEPLFESIPVLATWNIRSEKAIVRAKEPTFTGCKKTCRRGNI
jgi:hypothetical protein